MQPTAPSPNAKANKQKLIWGLVCLIGPTALLIVAFLLYAVINFITAATAPAPTGDELFAEPSPAHAIGNIILFLAGAISVITWLPGIIGGIILLSTRKK